MIIEYKTELDVRFHVNTDKGRRWTLIKPFLFSVNGTEFEVPAGFWTDFASIPRPLWNLLSPYDIGQGPVPHDYFYFTGCRDKDFADQTLRACMEHDGIAPWKRTAVYNAVQWFGGSIWDTYRKQGSPAAQYARLINRNDLVA
jgi:hypothetical protein